MAKHIQFDDYGTGHHANCVACEELFADALDNLLSPADQIFFDLHLRTCASCSESFAQAQRGAAWLELLKTTPPEPSADLIARILAETTGAAEVNDIRVPHPRGARVGESQPSNLPQNILPFVPRPAPRTISRFTRVAMEPRLAMTAAMAFFSIALTLNLLGVRLDQIKTADLSPTSLKQTYFQANATAVRYYDNLKVVRVLESRVDTIRESNAIEPEATPQPKSQPDTQPSKQPTPHGSSRRESPLPAAPSVLSTQLDFTTEPLRRSLFVAAPHFDHLTQEGGLA